jgi:hypothetical protein
MLQAEIIARTEEHIEPEKKVLSTGYQVFIVNNLI